MLSVPSGAKEDIDPASLPPTLVFNSTCEDLEPAVQIGRIAQTLFPLHETDRTESYVLENKKMLRILFRCIEMDTCDDNRKKVVILASPHFTLALKGFNGGEDIWANSIVYALRNMGYTFLYAFSTEHAIQLYQMFPDMVKAVLVEDHHAFECFDDHDSCVLSDSNPDGIPAWKIFSFYFWTGPENPLGRNWTLSPEEYAVEGHNPNIHIGYSVEPTCMAQEFIAHNDRNIQAYIMTKRLAFLAASDTEVWPPHFFEAAAKATGLEFVMGADPDGGGESVVVPDVITNYGLLKQKEFVSTLAHSRVLIGVGMPVTSPTPYEALCLGVPFINPIVDWDHDNPTDRMKWGVQHGMLKFHDPPYVYNVFKNDLDGFVGALQAALANPIDRYILDRMRLPAVTARVRDFLETDWRQEAAKLLEERKATGSGQLFKL